jgi:hypothetical protein
MKTSQFSMLIFLNQLKEYLMKFSTLKILGGKKYSKSFFKAIKLDLMKLLSFWLINSQRTLSNTLTKPHKKFLELDLNDEMKKNIKFKKNKIIKNKTFILLFNLNLIYN